MPSRVVSQYFNQEGGIFPNSRLLLTILQMVGMFTDLPTVTPTSLFFINIDLSPWDVK